jgi:hypothetical protein
VITIGRKERIVIATERYSEIYLFTTIDRDNLGKVNAKLTTFQLYGGPITAKQVALTDITFHEQIKLVTKVETIYLEK